MNGPLGEGVVPGLLRELYVGRRTGYLHFRAPGQSCSVLFRHGHIVHARSDLADHWLRETLVRHGLVAREDVERAAALASRESRRLGTALLSLGVIDQPGLEQGMALQVREILLNVFSWKVGAYEFEELDDPSSSEVTLKISTGEMILEAVRQVQDAEAVRYALGDTDRILCLSTDPLLRFQNITLGPVDGYVLSCVDGTLSAREIVERIPFDAAETSKSLFGLLSTGLIEYLPVTSAPRAGSARPAAAASERPAPPPAPPAPAAPPSAGSMPGDAQPEIETRRREIVEAYEALSRRTHYEILGVSRTATEAEIKEAYFRLARRFHPDAHHAPALSDLRAKLEATFIRLGAAYEVLRDPRRRANYDSSLPATPAPEPAGGPPPPPDPAFEKRVAADNLRRAERHLSEARYWDAIQLFEPALERLEGKERQRAQIGLARALAKNPNWVKQAEERLQELLHDNPQHVEALLELAGLYKSSGLRSRAVSTYRKVLDLQPDHEQALAELGALAPEPPPEDAGGGLLKRLFGRR